MVIGTLVELEWIATFGDKSFFYIKINGKLKGVLTIHVDDLKIAGRAEASVWLISFSVLNSMIMVNMLLAIVAVLYMATNPRGPQTEVLHSRFGTNGEGIPLEMCPCGNRKATLRRFLVARRYVVDDAEKMLRDTIEWRTNVTIGGVKGVELILKLKVT